MNAFQKRFLNSLKFLGLIILVVVTNVTPMFLIRFQSELGGGVKWFLALAYAAVVIFSITWLWKWYQKGVPGEHQHQKIGWKDFGIVMLFYLAGRVIAVAGTVINQLVSGNQMSMNDQAIFGLTAGLKEIFPPFTICFLLAIGIIAPIVEELVFRGLASQLFFSGGNKWVAAIVTSLIFGLLHASNLIEWIMYTSLGVVFYLAYARRRNIKDSILLHMLNNIPPAILLAYTIFS